MLGPVAPPIGGVTSHIESLCQRLSQHGYSAIQVAIVRSLAVEDERTFLPKGPLALLQRIRQLRPNLLHVHVGGQFNARVSALIVALARIVRVPVVLTIHSGGFPTAIEMQRPLSRLWIRRACRHADAIIAVNSEIARAISSLDIEDLKIHQIAPHARLTADDVSEFLPPSLDEFFSSHSPTLISVGQLEPEYQVDFQLRALDAIKGEHPRAGLIVIGSGSMLEELEKKTSNNPNVLIYGGLPNAQALLAIARSDVLVRTTAYDGDALSIREAIQLGTLVVASDVVTRPPEVVTYPSANLALFVEQLRVAIRSANRVGPRGIAGNEQADELNRIVDLYETLLVENQQVREQAGQV